MIAAEDFLKALLSSPTFQNRLPHLAFGKVSQLTYKHISCNVLNLSYFDFLEQLDIVNPHTGKLKGCPDEWVEEICCSSKLRLALLWEEDENYEEIH